MSKRREVKMGKRKNRFKSKKMGQFFTKPKIKKVRRTSLKRYIRVWDKGFGSTVAREKGREKENKP